MASAVYPKALEAFLKADIDLDTVAVNAVLLDLATYTYNAAHDFYDDLTGVVGSESGDLASKTMTNGVFDAADITFSSVTGVEVGAVAVFVDRGGVASADNLLSYNEFTSAVTPNGGDITVQWNASGIFSI
jgi:hypothetical protein